MKVQNNKINEIDDDLLPEYNFDYSKAMPNKYANMDKRILIEIDSDIAEIFNDSEKINNILRAIINSLPKSHSTKQKQSIKSKQIAAI